MSKVNQIQQALLEIGSEKFQKLVDAYLVAKNFGPINSTGSVVAADKVRRGTPDTLIALPDGKFIFAEHTTQRRSLFKKMKDDLDKCFDEDKTGIPVNRIERIIYCFTGKLNTGDQNELTVICQEKGVKLDLFGIDALAYDLYGNYPALARDYLNVSIDTGQIVPLEHFCTLYNSNKLATRLDHAFHFREEEVSSLLEALENNINLIHVSGRAGVGKTRVALEACRRYREVHPEYEVRCVFGRNVDLWEDLQVYFKRPGCFLILVDDTNRVSNFDYVVDLLQHQREDQRIKVVGTVRDYAAERILDKSRSIGDFKLIELNPFTDEQIKVLLTKEYEIVNSFYLERIAGLAHGNPRLAVMAAEVVKKGSLSDIFDVSSLYDRYFCSIREDLSKEGTDTESADLLRVAAIVSFFKAVDRTNEKMMNLIEDTFGISPAAFWETGNRLHELEWFDMHEDEVLRISDQLLCTYLFYLAVFKEKVLSFGTFLSHFFPQQRHRLIDSINPILDAFDSERIIEAMRPHVDQLWSEFEKNGDEEKLLHLLEVFWFTKRTDTLVWIKERIDGLEPEPVDFAGISFAKSSSATSSPSILNVLSQFASIEKEDARIAIRLLLNYCAKRSSQVPEILRILIDDYGFRYDSYLRQFDIQIAVVDELGLRTESGELLFSRLFLAVVDAYLGTHFENHGMKDARVLEIRQFQLPASPDIVDLRKKIWQRLFALYNQDLRDDVLGLIRHYCTNSLGVTNSEIVRDDSKCVLPFLESALDPNSFLHCFVLHDYLDLLEKHDGEAPEGLRVRYCNDTYKLAELLLLSWHKQRELDLSYEEFEQYKRERLKEHTKSYTLNDYTIFFERCVDIWTSLDGKIDEYEYKQGVVNVLLALAERDFELYGRTLGLYLEHGEPLQMSAFPLIQKLLEQQGRDGALRFLNGGDYPTRVRWLFTFHEALLAEDADEEMLAHLYRLYEAAEGKDMPNKLDYLLKYRPLDERVVAKVVAIVLNKSKSDSSCLHILTMLFNPHVEIAPLLFELFTDNLELLKEAYLTAENARSHNDYNGRVFELLIENDLDFIVEYVDWKYKNAAQGWINSYDEQRDYSFIWLRPDHQEIMDKVIESVYKHERDHSAYIEPYLKCFFLTRGIDHVPEGEEWERQDAFLLRIIDERSQDTDFMEYLFSVIAHFQPERRHQFIQRFVHRNKSFEAFMRLSLEPSLCSWEGSKVPVLEKRIRFWNSLLPFTSTEAALPHKLHIERRILDLRAQIEQEKKNDFIGD